MTKNDRNTIIVLILCFALCAFAAAIMVGYATGNAIQDSKCKEYTARFDECRTRFNNECLNKQGGMFGYENFTFNVSLAR